MTTQPSRMSLGGKLSLCYLVTATLLFFLDGFRSAWLGDVLALPFVALAVETANLTGYGTPWPQPAGVIVFALLWVANAFFWGHSAAFVVRRIGKRFATPVRSRDA